MLTSTLLSLLLLLPSHMYPNIICSIFFMQLSLISKTCIPYISCKWPNGDQGILYVQAHPCFILCIFSYFFVVKSFYFEIKFLNQKTLRSCNKQGLYFISTSVKIGKYFFLNLTTVNMHNCLSSRKHKWKNCTTNVFN